tara:strand:- start:1261 stop:1692 length:432 start_codon:yes stop_codon:yes gene_type:complete
MKKNDLKQLIKPLVKECIHEVLIEEGLLSNVVAEVAKGLQGNLVVEAQQKQPNELFNEGLHTKRKSEEAKVKMRDHREKLMSSINAGAYNGVDLFEGTEPMSQREMAEPKEKAGSVDLGNPGDSGVDISSMMGSASKLWKAMK